MPTVPTAKPGGSVALRPATPVFDSARGANVSAFGGAQGKALEGVGDVVSGAGDLLSQNVLKLQAEDNERDAKALDVEFSSALRSIGYGDGTEQNPGYYSLRGQAAVDAHPGMVEQLEKTRKALGEQAKNGRVKDMFDASSLGRQERELISAVRFYETQRQAANDTVSEARQSEAADDAAASPFDPRVLAVSLATARAEVVDMGKRRGWSSEVVNHKVEKSQTHILRSVIVAALRQDPHAAQAIYDANKDRIDGVARAEIKQMLEPGVFRAQAQEKVDEYFALNLPETEMLEKARAEIKDAKLRDEVVSRLKVRYAEIRLAEQDQLKEVSAAAYAWVWEGKSLDAFAISNPEGFRLISGNGPLMNALQLAEDRVRKRAIYARVSDGKTLHSIRMLPLRERAKVNLDEKRAKLTETEVRTASKLIGDAQGILKDLEENQAIYETGESVLRDHAPQSLLNAFKENASASATEVRQVQALNNEMASFIYNYIQSEDKKPSRLDIKTEAMRLSLPIVADPSNTTFFGLVPDKGEESFEGIAAQFRALSPEQLAVARVKEDKIPPVILQSIKRYIKVKELVETKDLIENIAGSIAMDDFSRFPDFSGFSRSRKEALAAQVKGLSPKQMAFFRVNVEDIPLPMLNAIRGKLRDIKPGTGTDDLVENLAGALATNNHARVRALLGVK